MPKTRLALVVIARNEARCIGRCLSSASAFVDKMIVLDTGSTDDTMAIARAHGAEVHQMTWVDDFSAARNRALELADADWNLVLDADEWIESGAECLKVALCNQALGAICIRSDLTQGQEQTWIPRLLPRGVRYRGKIHEQPVWALAHVRIPLKVGHDGYLPAQRQRKAGRNLSLLQQELAQQPDNAYLLYQIGKEFDSRSDPSQAVHYYLKASANLPANAGYKHSLMVRTLYCLGQTGQLDQALALAEEHMSEWAESPDFFFILGNVLLASAAQNPERAADHWLPLTEAAWIRCLEIGDRPELSGTLCGSGSFLAAHNLAAIYRGTNDEIKAQSYEDLSKALRACALQLPV